LHFIFSLKCAPSFLYLSSDIFTQYWLLHLSLIFAQTSGPDPPLHFTSHASSTPIVSSEPIMVVFILVYAQNLFKLLSRLVQHIITNLFIYNKFWDHQRSSIWVFNITPSIPFPFTNQSQSWIDFLRLCDNRDWRFLQTMFI
jgi:hypothetical protein